LIRLDSQHSAIARKLCCFGIGEIGYRESVERCMVNVMQLGVMLSGKKLRDCIDAACAHDVIAKRDDVATRYSPSALQQR
jgi:hypothetical protein